MENPQSCTVHISAKNHWDNLPSQQHLRRFLRNFGKISDFYEWRLQDEDDTSKRPKNNALVLFESSKSAHDVLQDSNSSAPESFWVTQSLVAYPLRPRYYRFFYGKLDLARFEEIPNGSSAAVGRQPWSERQSPASGSKAARPSSAEPEPPAKRPRNEAPAPLTEPTSNGAPVASSSKHPPPKLSRSNSSRTPSTTPESTEWMRARIAHLESELESAKAARDMAVSEQNVALIAHKAEKQARREALAQKSAAEAAQSRVEAEQARLLAELENAQPSKDVELLRVQLVAVEGKLKEAQASLVESTEANGRIKALEAELEEAIDRAHKLQIQKSRVEKELEEARSGTAQFDKSARKIEKLKAELNSAQEKLESTQKSLETMQRKYSTRRRKHEATKVKLGTYKEQLENERAIVGTLRETLTPAAYKTLGATHQTLGAFLSAMGLPPMDDQEPKEESD